MIINIFHWIIKTIHLDLLNNWKIYQLKEIKNYNYNFQFFHIKIYKLIKPIITAKYLYKINNTLEKKFPLKIKAK